MNRTLQSWAAALLGATLLTGAALAQNGPPPSAASIAQTADALSSEQLEQLAAPVALYPDPLLGQVMTAATYPLEIVEAARWRQSPENAGLSGDALNAALRDQPWDATVKALVGFPDVLNQLNDNLQWTEQLGEVFLARQADLMDAVQRLRQRASQAGNLHSTPQQNVIADRQYIEIQPATPDVVYVPYYDPWLVYGPWPWVDFPPFYFTYPPGIFVGGVVGFGIGIGISVGGPWWGGFGWDWGHHGFGPAGRGGGVPVRPWSHDPYHRLGVPYRDPHSAARFQGASEAARRQFRGYPTSAAPAMGAGAHAPQFNGAGSRNGGPAAGSGREPERAVEHAPERAFERAPGFTASPPPRLEAPSPRQNSAPAFESFGRGPQVRMDSSRGSSSRSFAPSPTPSFSHGGGGGARGGGGGGGGGGGSNRGGGGSRRP